MVDTKGDERCESGVQASWHPSTGQISFPYRAFLAISAACTLNEAGDGAHSSGAV